ncbi:unnamed protein product [Mucor hiemalis]
MKLVTLTFVFAFAQLGSALFTQQQIDALVSIPCDIPRRKYFDTCVPGPGCLDCLSKGADKCIAETNTEFFDLGCYNCDVRARYIYCRVNPLDDNKEVKDSDPILEVFKKSDAYKKYVEAGSSSSDNSDASIPPVDPATNAIPAPLPAAAA